VNASNKPPPQQQLLQQGKGQQGPGQPLPTHQPKPQDPEPVLWAVARVVSELLTRTAPTVPQVGASCFRIALEVLEMAGAGKLLHLVLHGNTANVKDSIVGQVVHAGWLADARRSCGSVC
jgi:hypothetical protein